MLCVLDHIYFLLCLLNDHEEFHAGIYFETCVYIIAHLTMLAYISIPEGINEID